LGKTTRKNILGSRMEMRCGMEGEEGIKSPMFLACVRENLQEEKLASLSEGRYRKLEIWF